MALQSCAVKTVQQLGSVEQVKHALTGQICIHFFCCKILGIPGNTGAYPWRRPWPDIPCDGTVQVQAAGFVYDGEDDADPTVVLCAMDHEKIIVYAKPGDTVWLIVHDEELVPYSEGGLSVRGKFYVPTLTGNVRRLELQPQPHLLYVARQEARHRWCVVHSFFFDVMSFLEPNVDDAADGGMILLRFIDGNVEMFWVKFTDGKGSLTLVEDQKDVDSFLLPWLTLGSKSSED